MMRRPLYLVVCCWVVSLLTAPPAMGAFGFKEVAFNFTNADDTPAAVAGSHPYAVTTMFEFTTKTVKGTEDGNEVDLEVPEGEVRSLKVELPAGFTGNANTVPRCSGADFATIDKATHQPACSSDTAIGVVGVSGNSVEGINPDKEPPGPNRYAYAPVYNLEPPPGSPAELGFLFFNVPVTVEVGVTEQPPYNLVAELDGITQIAMLFGSKLTVWGNPADSAHDPYRGHCLDADKSFGKLVSLGNCSVSEPQAAFLTLPRSCGGPLDATFTATSWTGDKDTAVATTPEGMDGCQDLKFGPVFSAIPSTSSAESPSGLDVNLDVEDKGLLEADGIADSDIRAVRTVLPPGMTVNPSAAEGLAVCTKTEFESISVGTAGCPGASKIGSAHLTTPLLAEGLDGSVYVAQPDDPGTAAPGSENPFDSFLAAYLVIRNQKLGISVKQAGEIQANPFTGQLTASFDGIPQFPLSHVGVRLREGPRAPLVTPLNCGTHTTAAELTPWSSNPSLPASSSFTLSSGPGGGACLPSGVPRFRPGFDAGSIDNNAGSFSPFSMRITREDGDQDLTRLDAVLPSGVTGKIAGLARCSDAAIEAAKVRSGLSELMSPSCPLDSQLGQIVAGAGVGSELTYVGGRLYLAGPFAGNPLSVVAVVPAVAGPFDVGTVVTREALALNPFTGEVEVNGAHSEPIPHLLRGIPLRLRDLRIDVNRPEFTLNPTSCDEESTRAELFGSSANLLDPGDDVPVSLSERYQAANCSALGFRPKFSIRFKGSTKRTGHPAVRTVLQPHAGDANVDRAVVILPPTENIENAHIQNPCTRVQFNENACPKGSILGTAKAITPLLDEPLEGPVYFRSNGGDRLLPDIVADLHGPFHIVLVGFVDSVRKRIRTTFATVPDAPVSRFTLDLYGGKRGLLVNNSSLCIRPQRLSLLLLGQNGRRKEGTPAVKTSCKKKHRQHRAG